MHFFFIELWTADRKRMIYQGDFERGKIQGVGVYDYGHGVMQSTNTAAGTTAENKKQSSSLSNHYSGDFKENSRNGVGVYYLPDGSVYNGTWRENQPHGRGLMTWPDHSVYDGEWKDGRRYVLAIVLFVLYMA